MPRDILIMMKIKLWCLDSMIISSSRYYETVLMNPLVKRQTYHDVMKSVLSIYISFIATASSGKRSSNMKLKI